VTADASQVRRTLADDDEGPVSKALEPDQIRRLFEVAAGSQWEPLLATLALLGVRCGEALGLSWSDVDLDTGIVTIRRSLSRVKVEGKTRLVLAPTKTRSSRRPLPLPLVLVSLLRSWRSDQARQRLRAGKHWGGGWARENLVFTTSLGTPLDPDNLRHALDRLGREAGIGHVHPHQLRHSVASVLIAHGHTPPEVARVLGHSSPSVTMSYYAHAFDRATVRAVETVADAIAGSGLQAQ
jgi:integrase